MRFDHAVICQFQFICNERWENLTSIPNESAIRFCHVCNSQVHLTDNYKDLERNIAAKRCVVIFLENSANKPFELMGGPMPSSEAEAIPELDPIVFRPLNELDLLSSTTEILKVNGIQFIGDLITRTKVQIFEEYGVTENQLHEILATLGELGLAFNMTVKDWEIESAKFR